MRGQDLEEQLLNKIISYKHDPLGFVLFAFPWGMKGTPLEGMSGPQQWQAEELVALGNIVKSPSKKGRRAVASGKGIGKSCLVAWEILWGLCTFPDTRIRVTAGTETQLRTMTWPEVAKWYRMLICKHWLRFTATALYASDPDHEKTWRADAIAWNENNPEAFAGLHNKGRRIIKVFDEASQIADPIFETTNDGIFTDADTEVIWSCYGNPTRGEGYFRECFDGGLHASRWVTRNIDSRDVLITDKDELNETVRIHGEDSDLVRSLVRGLFPRVASMQFIGMEEVREARIREVATDLRDPLIIGVDVARFGANSSVLAFRKGRDARSLPWIVMNGADTIALASKVAEAYRTYHADAVHVDEGGVGGGVVDALRSWGIPVRGVQFGGKPDRTNLTTAAHRYANKRAEMWGTMKEALPGLAIPNDAKLATELTSVMYGYRGDMEIQLESKEKMLRRDAPSPDMADALALTFAYPVQPRDNAGGIHARNRDTTKALTEYDPYAMA